MKNFLYLFLFLASIVFNGCSGDDDYGPQNRVEEEDDLQPASRKAFVLNEGNFMHGNASLDVYDLDHSNLSRGVFERENGKGLGDVAQSGFITGDTLAVVVNNSGKILLINAGDYSLIDEITGLNSPRYVAVLPGGNWLVSELYNNQLTEVNPKTKEVVQNYPLEGWTEEIHAINENLVFVRNISHKSLDVYDLSSAGLVSRGAEGEVTGVAFGEHAAFFVTSTFVGRWAYAAANFEVLFEFEDTLSARKPALAKDHDVLYFLAGGVYRAVLTEKTTGKIFDGTGMNLYGLAVEDETGDLFVTDTKDYTGRGTIYRLDRLGNKIVEKSAGIIPQAVVFYESPE